MYLLEFDHQSIDKYVGFFKQFQKKFCYKIQSCDIIPSDISRIRNSNHSTQPILCTHANQFLDQSEDDHGTIGARVDSWKVIRKIHLRGLFITLLLHSAGRYVVIADPAIPNRSIVLNCKRIPHSARNNGTSALCWLLRLTTSVSREEERSQHDFSFLRSTSDSSTIAQEGEEEGGASSVAHFSTTAIEHALWKQNGLQIYIYISMNIVHGLDESVSRMNAKRANGRVTGWNT